MKNQKSMNNKFKMLRRLLKDESGNTIIFMGAALIPLLAIIGGGVDASRGYMAKARLQQACDAATLAGRREVGNGSFTLIAEQTADRLFEANFETGFLGASNTTFTTASTNGGSTVTGIATTSIPTVIMRIFGNDTLDISVECEAAIDIANADITMVLDTTGSMGRDINGNIVDPTGAGRVADDNGNAFPGSRMFDLRAAAKSFYNVLDQASAATNSRIRYGFVPYSSSVNAGSILINNSNNNLLIGQNSGETHIYPSRRAVYEAPISSGPVSGQFDETFRHTDGSQAYLTTQNCDRYSNNQSFNYFTVVNFRATARSFTPTNPGNPVTIGDVTASFSRQAWGGGFQFPDGTLILECTRRVNTETETFVPTEVFDPTTPGAEFKRWEYTNVELSVSDYVASLTNNIAVTPPTNLPAGFTFPVGFNTSQHVGNAVASTWQGCIEERQTVAANPGDIEFDSLLGITPSAATDLDIDSLPTNDATRWKPYWPEISFLRATNDFSLLSNQALAINGSQSLAFNSLGQLIPLVGPDIPNFIQACPQPIQTLSELSRTEFDTYIDSLKPAGATYHDLGALWGARISSPDGIFADGVNVPAPNNGLVSRNMIFLTDGETEPRNWAYSSYGIEFLNPNAGIANSTDADLAAIHNARFLAICEAIKAKGIRIFVIAFGTALTTELQTCSSVNSAFVAADSSELENTFTQIATNIADLRLTN